MPAKPTTVAQYLEIGCGRCELGGTPQCKVLPWMEELRLLRKILLSSGLTEVIKWSAPCYLHQGKNILMLSALKDSVVISYFQGAQLTDPDKLLEKPGANSRYDFPANQLPANRVWEDSLPPPQNGQSEWDESCDLRSYSNSALLPSNSP